MSRLETASLEDKYSQTSGIVFLTGIQALVRLPLLQRQLDAAAGLNTAGFISGYRGSPLGGYDVALLRESARLEKENIVFQPGVNEDLAATALWGSQQTGLFEGARYDGVFGIWYGKGPGVDRSGDVLKHANAAGTAPHGGVLALAGDDHTCKSSTLPHQSEYAFIDANIPVLNPSGVGELLEYGVKAIAMSRFAGIWVAMKTIAETLDSSATVTIDPDAFNWVTPAFDFPQGGVHIRWPDPPLDQERRLHQYKIYAALEFCRANRFNTIEMDSPRARFGIVSTGKSWLDVLQALDDLGIDEQMAEGIGLRLYKVGMPWPLEPEGVRQFAEGLQEVLVVEEKRAIIENQLKEQLYNWRSDLRPRVIGKFDENRDWILPSNGELTPARIARVIAARIKRFVTSERIEERIAFLAQKESALEGTGLSIQRIPHFCSGCPHNTSTKVPEGSRALAGIGCHYMAIWMDRRTETFTQMGGEGASWIGQAPFTDTGHVFVNLGDGTYFHSGLLAIRAAIASGVNVTYKILVNDAVAMTGGQPVDGNISLQQMAHQLDGEGAKRIVVVSEFPERYTDKSQFPIGVEVFGRDELARLQLEFREIKGTSVILYDQVCATEKRRRRKRGLMDDPHTRVFINSEVCEGCGDCSRVSNCLSVVPLETPLGRKRVIDQSACNMDLSCVNGFCPSFVTLKGAHLKKSATERKNLAVELTEPRLPDLDQPYRILITGVGGTGVVTVSALLGTAAWLDGKGSTVLDMTGLAQKYGAVSSHVQISSSANEIKAVRIAAGKADLLLGCDSVVAAGFDSLSKLEHGYSSAVVNDHNSATAQFLSEPDLKFPADNIEALIKEACGEQASDFFDATMLAEKLLGNTIGANLMLVGFAWQKGKIPLSVESLERAIELNGVAVDFNKQAFLIGRQMALAPDTVLDVARDDSDNGSDEVQSVEDSISEYVSRLTAYQDADYADRFRVLVERVREAEQQAGGSGQLAQTVALNYYRLLAVKDEYEVARLLTADEFRAQLDRHFEDGYTIEYNLAPPFLSRIDPITKRPIKQSFGPWLKPVLGFMAKQKWMRGRWFDPFARLPERREEQRMTSDYENDVNRVLSSLTAQNQADALRLMNWPAGARGFGPVKAASVEHAYAERKRALDGFEKAMGSPAQQ